MNIIEKITLAITTIHTATNNESRQQSLEFLQEMEREMNQDVVVQLINTNINTVQFYALHVASNLKSIDLICKVVSLIKTPILISKVSMVIVDWTIQSWPINFPLDSLLMKWYREERLDLVLNILKELVLDLATLNDSRKPLLVQSLSAIIVGDGIIVGEVKELEYPSGGWLGVILSTLSTLSAALPGSATNTTATYSTTARNAKLLLSTLAALIEFIPFDELFNHNVAVLLFRLMDCSRDMVMLQGTIDCFSSLFQRHYPPNNVEKREMMVSTVMDHVDVWYRLWKWSSRDAIMNDTMYTIQLGISSILSIFVSRVVHNAEIKKEREWSVLVSMVTESCTSPLLEIVERGCECVQAISIHMSLEMAEALLGRTDKSTFSVQDDIDLSATVSMILRTIKTILVPLQENERWMESILERFFNGVIKSEQVWFCVQIVCDLFEGKLENVDIDNSSQGMLEKVDMFGAVLDRLLLYQPTLNSMKHVVMMLGRLAPIVMVRYPHIVPIVVERLLQASTFCTLQEQHCIQEYKEFGKLTVEVRQKSVSMLLKLMEKVILGGIEMGWVVGCVDYVHGLINQGKYFTYEARSVLECFVVCTAGVQHRSTFLDQVVGVHVPDLDRLATLVRLGISKSTGIEDLVNWISNGTALVDVNLHIQQRRWILEQFTHFGMYMKRSVQLRKILRQNGKEYNGDEWNRYITFLVPLCVDVIEWIHSVFVSTSYPIPFMERIVEPTIVEVGNSVPLQETNTDNKKWNTNLDPFTRWISRLRQECYQFLSTCCHFDSFYQLDLPLLMTGVFKDCKGMKVHHWKSFVRSFLISVFTCCPVDRIDVVTTPLIPIVSLLSFHLQEEWTAWLTTGNMNTIEMDVDTIRDDDQLTLEMVRELILRNTTRSFAQFWVTLFDTTLEGDQKLFRYPEWVNYSFCHHEWTNLLFQSLVMMMGMRDTVTCRMAMDVVTKLVERLVSTSTTWGFLPLLLQGIVQVLMDGYQTSNHHQAASLLATIYIQLRPHSTIPFDLFLHLFPDSQEIKVVETHIVVRI
jgi:hypothetical protein